MHSATLSPYHRFLRRRSATRLAIIAIAGISLSGCRTGRPGSSMVQVSEDPAAVVSNLPAPEQRLATTRTGKPTASPQTGASIASNEQPSAEVGTPVVGTRKVFARVAPSSDKPLTQSQTLTTQAGFSEEVKKTPAASNETATADATTAKTGTEAIARDQSTNDKSSASVTSSDGGVAVAAGGLVSASLTDLSEPTTASKKPIVEAALQPTPASESGLSESGLSESGLSESLARAATAADDSAGLPKGQPPRVRRRMNSTDQPRSLDQALKKSLADLPELPEASGDGNGPSPMRIGAPAVSHAGDLAVEDDSNAAVNANQIQTVSHASEQTPSETPRPSSNVDTSKPAERTTVDQMSVDELYGELLTRITGKTADENATDRERRQIIARYLMVLAGDPDSAVSSMDGLNENEQRYLKNHLQGLWTLIDPEGHPSSGRRITEALPRYREATLHMAAATDSLSLTSLEFCTEIEGYGQIKPFDGNRFDAGQQVILYCEVENFSAAQHEGGYQMQLQGSYDIYDASGTKMVSQLLPVDQQRSRNLLRDCFVAYQMNLHKQLPPGTYRLQLTLEDLVGKKYGQSNIPFEIR